MAITNDLGPKGEMTLVDYFHESSNSHYDESLVVTLSAGFGSHAVQPLSSIPMAIRDG
ncbi:hypothetical protein PQR75_41025 [Paraburkholderia fungorum]|uniref:hypothetical protein n=1 Tax=Paraburkholderia fungorum TaxID=134537 RepID=UPI0038B77B1E